MERSRRLLVGLLLALFTTTSGVAAADDAEHLFYLADQGLAVLRLQVEIDGKPQRELCRAQLAALCERADADRDGFLTDAEYQAAVVTHPAIQEAINRPGLKADALMIGEGKVPLAEVRRFLFHRLFPPLRLEFSSQRMGQINQAGVMQDRPLADAQLFEQLDADGNRKLTGRELDRAAAVLGKLDFDEDDIITLAELQMQSPPNATAARNPNASRRSDAYLSRLSSDRVDAALVRRVLSLYDGEAKGTAKDQRLDRTEVRLAESLFAQADADGDGFWDFDELWRFLEHPAASAEIRWRVSADAPSILEIAILDGEAIRSIRQEPTSVPFDIHGTRFQLNVPAQPSRSGSQVLAKQEFETLDADKNEYLELPEFLSMQPEAENDPRPALFRQMDADGDGKVFFHEYEAYARNRGALRDSQLALVVENLGRTLFGPLDLNGDGRLSQRELAQLKSRLPEWDADGDGRLVETEIPQQYRLTLALGGGGPNAMSGEARPAPSSAAPLWFRKMDRNRDGEVTAKEFLGTKPQFEKIDENADGAIDANEAARVK